MKHSLACRSLIMAFEGCELHAYPDPGTGGDPLTIGFGHTGPDVHRDTVWTPLQAQQALEADLAKFDAGVSALVAGHPTTQGQFDSLVALSFNIGLRALGQSTLLKAHNAGAYATAKAQFAAWNKSAGRVLPGLVKRRAAEAEMYGSKA